MTDALNPDPGPAPRLSGPEVQIGIYERGLRGVKPEIPASFDGLEARTRARLSPEAWAYVADGAGLGSTMDANRAAFARVAIAPRVLRGVAPRNLSVNLLGLNAAAPILTAPIGVLEMAHPEGDLAVARAAARLGLPTILSSQASFPMEEIARANGSGPRWFQLYWGRSDAVAESFVRRAEACGATAIVITLDTTSLGWRPRDLDLGFLPFIQGKGIAQYTSDPAFRALLSKSPEEDPQAAAVCFTRLFSDPSLDWARISRIRAWTRLPVILKGIMRPEDASKSVAEGYDAVIVSNHGGRQVDGALGALAALPGIAAAVGGRIPVLFDSGIRCGADIFKALALGAAAVCVGRPFVYGLALGGEAGVQTVLEYLTAELDLTMALTGCTTIADIRPDMVVVNGTP